MPDEFTMAMLLRHSIPAIADRPRWRSSRSIWLGIEVSTVEYATSMQPRPKQAHPMLPVLIVGAGPVGLLQALFLSRHGGESLRSTTLHLMHAWAG